MLESNSVHRTPPVRTSRRSPTCNLSSFLPFLPLFFLGRVGFESPLLSTPLSPAFWSPSKLDPHNAYAFTSLYDLRNEPEMSQPWFVVPFYSGCALAHGVMSPLIVSRWNSRSSFPFARLNLELLLRKSIVYRDDAFPSLIPSQYSISTMQFQEASVYFTDDSWSFTSVLPRIYGISK